MSEGFDGYVLIFGEAEHQLLILSFSSVLQLSIALAFLAFRPLSLSSSSPLALLVFESSRDLSERVDLERWSPY